jgi:hypothetical protein
MDNLNQELIEAKKRLVAIEEEKKVSYLVNVFLNDSGIQLLLILIIIKCQNQLI